jgi:Ser/Thr protein kinase RdoA (MazF antagonist)
VEKRIRERYNDEILHRARQRYGIAPGEIRLLDGFESFMYEFQRGGWEYILRLAHSIRRSEGLILGEVHWINYLVAGGAPAAQAIRSAQDRLVELIEDDQGGHFLATAFVKAQGKPPWEVGWTPELYETYGQLLGRMHALTQHYQVAAPAWRRPEWDDDLMLDAERNLPASEAIAVERHQQVVDHVQSLPKEAGSYGLIHFDAHAANLLIDESGSITLFDFDDCLYSWFIYDLAIVLFYMVTGVEDVASCTAAFLPPFLRGYRRENRLDPGWLHEMPWFLKLREIDLYAVIHRSLDVDNLDDPWCARYMRDRKRRIEENVPYIDFDFDSLAHLL